MIITKKRLNELLKQREEEVWKAHREMQAEERAERERCRVSDLEYKFEDLAGRLDAFEITVKHFTRNCPKCVTVENVKYEPMVAAVNVSDPGHE